VPCVLRFFLLANGYLVNGTNLGRDFNGVEMSPELFN